MSMRTKPIYGNCRVHHPDGALMFLCLEKRAKWYLDRNLAVVLSEDPLTIQLTFTPKGNGNIDDYYLSKKSNSCVVCGSEDLSDLTKHHVIPIEYRKHFPLEMKSRSSHDIVVICRNHHAEYENAFAQKLKKRLEKAAGIGRTAMTKDRIRVNRAFSYTGIMLDPERIKGIPNHRIEYFMKELQEIFGTTDPYEVAQLNLTKEMQSEDEVVGKQLIEKTEDLNEFSIMWRQHFLDCMKPQFLPDGWKVDYSTRTTFEDDI